MKRVGIIVAAGVALGVAVLLCILGVGERAGALTNWQAFVLGAVQGFTELMPISSSGHLILVPWLFEWTYLEENEGFNRTFDVALHLGTLVAVVAYFWTEFGQLVEGVVAQRPRESCSRRATNAFAWVVDRRHDSGGLRRRRAQRPDRDAISASRGRSRSSSRRRTSPSTRSTASPQTGRSAALVPQARSSLGAGPDALPRSRRLAVGHRHLGRALFAPRPRLRGTDLVLPPRARSSSARGRLQGAVNDVLLSAAYRPARPARSSSACSRRP